MFPTATILQRALTNASTASSFAAVATKTAEPATVDTTTPNAEGNTAVFKSSGQSLYLMPFGTDAADETFSIRLVGWKKLTGGDGVTPLWVPTHLGDVNVTLGSSVGVAGGIVTDSQYFADTLALASGGWADIKLIQTAGNLPAAIIVPSKGFEYIQALFDSTGAASMNLLWGAIPEL